MRNEIRDDTICALSTPPGIGAIAVIRLSGPRSLSVCSEIFRSPSGKTDLARAGSHTIHFGTISDGDQPVDDVLISIFRAPHSYTGEDVVEISCHGSVYVQQRILEILVSKKIRLAKPGEFTMRAFLNGKLDLSQAEAVADLIASRSEASHSLAIRQMRGGFSEKIRELRQKLLDLVSLIELELDFSEEDVEFVDRSELLRLLKEIESEVRLLIRSFSLGNAMKYGIPVAITGKPNAGKSTLLNAILNEERAIVSEIPGTTRDTIEDTIVIGGYSFRFIDTAGLREAENEIESVGIERTWQKIRDAEIILYVFDVREDSFAGVMESLKEFREIMEKESKHLVLIGNKTDKLKTLPKGFSEFVEFDTVFVSAKRRENIHLIAENLLQKVSRRETPGEVIISNTRHYEALRNTLESINEVYSGLEKNLSPDLLSPDIRKALYHLGEITGEITNDDILGNIFGRFCIGK